MTAHVEHLAWDTEFFGFPVGRVALDGVDERGLTEIDAEAREQGLVCLYGSLDPIDAATSYRVQERGYRFVDAPTMFDLRREEPTIPRPEGVRVRQGTPDDLPAMDGLVAKLAEWSRFSVDPRFGLEAAHRVQAAWVARAAACETGEFSLVVAEDGSGINSFITRATQPRPVIDTVGTSVRGSGAARYLVEITRPWAGDQALLGGPIAARNVNAIRYVANCGYRVRWVQYMYHRWLDEDT